MSTRAQLHAYEDIKPKLGARQEQVMGIVNAGPDGATLRDIADRLGLDLSGVSPRITELQALGLVYDSGRTRVNVRSGKMITVWLPAGPKQL